MQPGSFPLPFPPGLSHNGLAAPRSGRSSPPVLPTPTFSQAVSAWVRAGGYFSQVRGSQPPLRRNLVCMVGLSQGNCESPWPGQKVARPCTIPKGTRVGQTNWWQQQFFFKTRKLEFFSVFSKQSWLWVNHSCKLELEDSTLLSPQRLLRRSLGPWYQHHTANEPDL